MSNSQSVENASEPQISNPQCRAVFIDVSPKRLCVSTSDTRLGEVYRQSKRIHATRNQTRQLFLWAVCIWSHFLASFWFPKLYAERPSSCVIYIRTQRVSVWKMFAIVLRRKKNGFACKRTPHRLGGKKLMASHPSILLFLKGRVYRKI